MDYFYQLLNLVKRWSSYFGLTNRENFEDAFYKLLHDKNYDEAFKLAKQHSYLDIDLVYKCKWRNSGITVQTITSVLASIQDKLWAVNECVQTVPISHDACRTILEYGLEQASLRLLYDLGNETTPSRPASSQAKYGLGLKQRDILVKEISPHPTLPNDMGDDEILGLIDFENLNDQQKELCRCRQDLIRHRQSFEAYENVLGDYRAAQQQFDHVFYDEFRTKCPLNACIDFANDGDGHAVEVMLNSYTEELVPHLLSILSSFPETLSPFKYRNLLPKLNSGKVELEWVSLWSVIDRATPEPDWSNRVDINSSFLISLGEKATEYETEFYIKNSHLVRYQGPLTPELLTEWYLSRALEMENRTLLITSSIQLLHLGTEMGVPSLKDVHDKMSQFGRIIYDKCNDDDNLYLSYSDFIKMSEFERLVLMSGDLDECYEACELIMKKKERQCWSLCYELAMHKQFKNDQAKYKLLGFALAYCDDPDGKLSAKILEHVIELRKRDERIQLVYLQRNM